jgi:hypothetical protein
LYLYASLDQRRGFRRQPDCQSSRLTGPNLFGPVVSIGLGICFTRIEAMYCVVQLARYAESSLGARHASRIAAWPGNAIRRLFCGQTRRLDVEEQGHAGNLRVQPPSLPRRQEGLEKTDVAAVERIDGTTNQLQPRLTVASAELLFLGRRQEPVPVQNPLFPQRPFASGANTGQMNKRVPKHQGHHQSVFERARISWHPTRERSYLRLSFVISSFCLFKQYKYLFGEQLAVQVSVCETLGHHDVAERRGQAFHRPV